MSFFVREREDLLLGKFFYAGTLALRGSASQSSGAKAAGNPRTEPSSLHLSACAYDYQAAPPPGNLERITHTNDHSWCDECSRVTK